jgi:hypothetical protein
MVEARWRENVSALDLGRTLSLGYLDISTIPYDLALYAYKVKIWCDPGLIVSMEEFTWTT